MPLPAGALLFLGLAVLNHDYGTVNQTLDHARLVGDRSENTKNLKGLITRNGVAASSIGSTAAAYASHDANRFIAEQSV